MGKEVDKTKLDTEKYAVVSEVIDPWVCVYHYREWFWMWWWCNKNPTTTITQMSNIQRIQM